MELMNGGFPQSKCRQHGLEARATGGIILRMRNAAIWVALAIGSWAARAQEGVVTKNVIGVSGTGFTLNDRPFAYTGVSFFNAIYNPNFNKSSEERAKWLAKFRKYGINVL